MIALILWLLFPGLRRFVWAYVAGVLFFCLMTLALGAVGALLAAFIAIVAIGVAVHDLRDRLAKWVLLRPTRSGWALRGRTTSCPWR
jgi:hypothetical protein